MFRSSFPALACLASLGFSTPALAEEATFLVCEDTWDCDESAETTECEFTHCCVKTIQVISEPDGEGGCIAHNVTSEPECTVTNEWDCDEGFTVDPPETNPADGCPDQVQYYTFIEDECCVGECTFTDRQLVWDPTAIDPDPPECVVVDSYTIFTELPGSCDNY